MSFLQRLFGGKTPRRIEHPTLGEALLIEAKHGSYWEIETEVQNRPFTLPIEAPDGAEPSPEQVAFFRKLTSTPEVAFSMAAPLLRPEFEKWMRMPFPPNWPEAFEFVGMSVPVGGDERKPWDLSFECLPDRNRHLFTCSFAAGLPSAVQIDG